MKGATVDAALALLSQIEQACVKGAQVQFRPEGASQISYLDLEAADINPEYSHFHLIHGYLKATLVLHCRPYANTGTTRLVASVVGGSAYTFSLLATGVLGDVPALANIAVSNIPSSIGNNVSGQRMRYAFLYGVHRSASFNPIRLLKDASATRGRKAPRPSGTRQRS